MPEPLLRHSFADLWHPGVLAWVILLQAAYLLLTGPLRVHYGWGAPVSGARRFWFSAGLWVIYLSEGTPLHVLAEHYLFSAHMVQHVLLTMLMPPLLLLGTPDWALRPLLRMRALSGLLRVLTRPLTALVIFNLIYSLWHLPDLYQAALFRHELHMVQHGVLVATALLMWWPVASPLPELPRLHEGLQMLYTFLIGLAQVAVYAIVTYAERPLYGFYVNAPRVWGIEPLGDQQLAGVIMKLGGMFAMVVVWVAVFMRWAAREGVPGLPSPREHSEGKGS